MFIKSKAAINPFHFLHSAEALLLFVPSALES